MVLSNGYDLNIKIDGKDIEFDPASISFILSYNIWDMLPKGYLVIDDQSSLLGEYLITTPGTEVYIELGANNILNIGDFIIDYDKITEVDDTLSLGGKLVLPLIHKWLKDQERSSTSYQERISDVVQKVVSKYPFSSAIINSTENQGSWFQLLHFDTEFIENILLPKAYSSNANNTPFFTYIDNFNNFNFRNLKAMNAQKHADLNLNYRPTPSTLITKDSIFDITRKRMSYKDVLKYKKVKSYIINNETGNLESQENSIFEYSDLNTSDKVPIRKGEDVLTNFRVYDKNQSFKEVQGEIQFDQRESLIIDAFNLIIPFNPVITLGYKLNLSLSVNTGQEVAISQYSGEYLISKINIIWESGGSSILQKIQLIRKGETLIDEYILKDDMIGE